MALGLTTESSSTNKIYDRLGYNAKTAFILIAIMIEKMKLGRTKNIKKTLKFF